MNQKIRIVSLMMVLGAFIISFSSNCDGMSIEQNTPEEKSKNDVTTMSVASSNLNNTVVFLGEGEIPRDAVVPSSNPTSSIDSKRGEKQYPNTPYIPYPAAISPYGPFIGSYSAAVADGYFNPFPNYYPARLGGITGPGNLASSCAYAYPNRRYSCLGLGRRK